MVRIGESDQPESGQETVLRVADAAFAWSLPSQDGGSPTKDGGPLTEVSMTEDAIPDCLAVLRGVSLEA